MIKYFIDKREINRSNMIERIIIIAVPKSGCSIIKINPIIENIKTGINTFIFLVLSMIPLGFGGGAIDTTLNNYYLFYNIKVKVFFGRKYYEKT